MTMIAPLIEAFLRQRLPEERNASSNTCDTYSYAFQLLFGFASRQLGAQPSDLSLEEIDAALVLAFLEYLETDRGNCPSTRNNRLAAIKSFMRYVQHKVPSALEQIRSILAIPTKKTESRLVNYLNVQEMQAILDAPDPSARDGIRDRAMFHLAFATGLRVSELVGLRLDDLALQPTPSIRILGKGRKERQLPLWKGTITVLRAWLAVRGDASVPELFLNARDQALTRSGFEYILAKHVKTATAQCASLGEKRVSPHVLRHTCAMNTFQATKDLRKVSLWLGHANMQTAEIYLRADPTEKLEAIESMIPPQIRRGHFRPPDKLIDWLKGSRLCGVDRPRGTTIAGSEVLNST